LVDLFERGVNIVLILLNKACLFLRSLLLSVCQPTIQADSSFGCCWLLILKSCSMSIFQ